MESDTLYENNIESLKKNLPDLFKYFEACDYSEEPYEVHVFSESSGYMNAVVLNPENGRSVKLHDGENPFAEASRLADDMDLKPGELRFLIGMGLGYLASEIVTRKIQLLKLFLVEKSFKLFEQALRNMDLTSLFEAEGLTIVIGNLGDIRGVIYSMESDVSIMLRGAEITYFEPERELFPDFYADCTKKIQDQVKHIMSGIQTTKRIGPRFFENAMKNFTTALESANLGVLDNILQGRPVMVVGAGPSLIENIATIKKYRNRFALITVDSALPILVKNGITPDLATTVDFHHISFEKYRDVIEKTEEIPIAYVSQCATMTIKPYRCPAKFFIAQPYGIFSDFAAGWKYWIKWQPIEAVSHLAVLCARVSGASPVILVGFDLSYVGLKSYAEGTALTSNVDIEALVWVKDQNDEPVPTSVQMVGQRTIMEHHISSSSARFVNISRGVRIEGTDPVDAESFLSSLPESNSGILPRTAIWQAWEKAPRPEKSDVVAYLKKAIKDLTSSIKYCEKGMDYARKAKTELAKGKDADMIKYQPFVLKAIDYYDTLVSKNVLLHTALGYYEGNDLNLKVDESRLALLGDTLTGVEKIEIEMALISRGIEARRNAGRRLLEIFNVLHSRLSKEQSLLADISRKNSGKAKAEIMVKLGEVYLNYNDFVEAEVILKKAIDGDPGNYNAYLVLGRTLSSLKRHLEAFECFKKAVKLNPKSNEAKKALESEMAWPERMLDEASGYIKGDDASSSGQGQENWAARICREIISLYPDNPRARQLLEKAQKIIDSLLKEQEALLPYLVGECASSLEKVYGLIDSDPDFAYRVLSLLKQQYPDNPSIIEAYGLCFLGKGDLAKAKNYFIQARSLNPEAYTPRVHLAAILAEEGNYDEALMYLEQAINIAPPDEGRFLVEAVGDILFEMKHFADALKNYEIFFMNFPERKDVLKKIGNCYAEMGLMEPARFAWDSAVKE